MQRSYALREKQSLGSGATAAAQRALLRLYRSSHSSGHYQRWGVQRLDRGNIFPGSIYSYLVETKILINFRLQQCAGSYQNALSDMEMIVLHGDIILSGI